VRVILPLLENTMRNITVDLSQFDAAMFRFPIVIKDEIRKVLKEQIGMVRDQARRNHRYMPNSGIRPSGRYYKNTGKLEQSTQSHVLEDGTVAEAYLESGIAKYGVYVHEGQDPLGIHPRFKNPWKPDKFLDKALEDREPFIRVAANQAVERAVARISL
jgi:hypothetical protein